MKEKFAKLIDVKSIITITLTATLVAIILASLNVEQNAFALFSNATMLCLGFFFGKPTTENK